MKKRWMAETPEERGKMAEEHFFAAWADSTHFPEWIVSVERPTLHEDIFQKTDAVIVRIHGSNLRIQIKAYWITSEDMQELMKCGVVPISLQQTDSHAHVRRLTCRAITRFERFHENLKKEYAQSQKRAPWRYYRGGKRYASDKRQQNRW